MKKSHIGHSLKKPLIAQDSSLEDIIRENVKNQLVSDVSLGSYMSGGVDSTLITNFANNSKDKFNSFNISINDKEYDEGEYRLNLQKFFNQITKVKLLLKLI